MVVATDWMPTARVKILAMAHDHITYMTEDRRVLWGIPPEQYAEYQALYGNASALLDQAMNIPERTHVLTVQCGGAFDKLKAKMRFFRDRYFKMPPLTAADWAALGFRLNAEHPTPSQPPRGMPGVTISYPGGPHMLTLRLGPLAGTEPPNGGGYGYAIYVGLMPAGGATLEQAASVKHYLMSPPSDGEPLKHYRFTMRRKEKISFESSEGGMTVYVCSRYENKKGEVGLWGPVSSAVVP
ncbi:MAG: hypothetical protein LBB61_09845 [Treponema sp.]|jgi:hypothetical protein|nr:hypothetical protein [Treponema sp.]